MQKFLFISIIFLSAIITSYGLPSDVFGIGYWPAPLKQIRDGTEPQNVTCTEGLELVLKKSNGLPICLKPTSVAKLIERGWAIHVLPDYIEENDNNSRVFSEGTYKVSTEYVNYFEGTQGFLAKPETDGQFPGIIIIHEWWGLNENIKEIAQKMASHGFVVLAVDLYKGNAAATSEEARKLVTSFDKTDGVENMNSAVSYLKENYNTQMMGSVGWCFGGGQSLNLAMNNSDLDATVIYYGQLVTDSSQLSKISWPILGIFAGEDSGIPVETVSQFESALDSLAIPNEIYIYPGVGHAFANPSGTSYAPEESKDAWQKTIEFLKNNLK